MNIHFEHDYQQKLMTQSFPDPTTLASSSDVQAWRQSWMKALSSWHSPYKVLVDCTNLTVGSDPALTGELDRMVRFFNGFFLRKIVGHGRAEGRGHEALPFPVLTSWDEAAVEVGLRQAKVREATDFRSLIQLQNLFPQHTIELSFAEPVTIESAEQVATLKSKLMNNLMQWHSKWSLMVDCSNLEIAPAVQPQVERLLAVLRGFFMKQAIGYSPRGTKETYPFPVFRARHRAAAELEGEGNFSGDQADCKSRKA